MLNFLAAIRRMDLLLLDGAIRVAHVARRRSRLTRHRLIREISAARLALWIAALSTVDLVSHDGWRWIFVVLCLFAMSGCIHDWQAAERRTGDLRRPGGAEREGRLADRRIRRHKGDLPLYLPTAIAVMAIAVSLCVHAWSTGDPMRLAWTSWLATLMLRMLVAYLLVIPAGLLDEEPDARERRRAA